MLQKPVHDAAHGDVLAQAGNLRTQAANAPHQKIDFHPGLRRAVKGFDDFAVHQRVDAGNDSGAAAAARIRRFALDESDAFADASQRVKAEAFWSADCGPGQ